MTASIINKTIKSIVAASAALIMAASVAACGPNAATPSEENNASNGGATTSKVTARSLETLGEQVDSPTLISADAAQVRTFTAPELTAEEHPAPTTT